MTIGTLPEPVADALSRALRAIEASGAPVTVWGLAQRAGTTRDVARAYVKSMGIAVEDRPRSSGRSRGAIPGADPTPEQIERRAAAVRRRNERAYAEGTKSPRCEEMPVWVHKVHLVRGGDDA